MKVERHAYIMERLLAGDLPALHHSGEVGLQTRVNDARANGKSVANGEAEGQAQGDWQLVVRLLLVTSEPDGGRAPDAIVAWLSAETLCHRHAHLHGGGAALSSKAILSIERCRQTRGIGGSLRPRGTSPGLSPGGVAWGRFWG